MAMTPREAIEETLRRLRLPSAQDLADAKRHPLVVLEREAREWTARAEDAKLVVLVRCVAREWYARGHPGAATLLRALWEMEARRETTNRENAT
jgi:hypothetical protein